MFILACGSGRTPPPGFEKECYGGDFKEHMEGNTPVVTVRVKAAEEQWPALAEHLRAFAASENLVFFDTTLYLKDVHALGLSVCSSTGVDISVNEQHWKQGPFKDEFDPNHVYLRFYKYKNFRGEPLAESLVKNLKAWDPDATVQ